MIRKLRSWLTADRPRQEEPLPEPTPFPPPFQRMVAVNSDVEWTTWPRQLSLIRAFAERALEPSFSFWCFAIPGFTWGLLDADDRPLPEALPALALIRAGVIDTLHSFGGVRHGPGCRINRQRIQRAYKFLENEGAILRVYSNHGSVEDVQNIGGDWVTQPGTLNYQQGDVRGSPSYHLDLTLAYGFRFFWTDIDRRRQQVGFLAKDGDLFQTQVSRDNSSILRFRRTDAAVDPVSHEFARQVNAVLDGPAGRYAVIYQHLGAARGDDGRAVHDWPTPSAPVLEGLDRLAREQRAGLTLVASTRRLLTHAMVMAYRPWRITRTHPDRLIVEFSREIVKDGMRFDLSWDDLAGFSLPLRHGELAIASLGRETRELTHWELAGRDYAGIPWIPIATGEALEEARRHAY
jgi:hypothetical protein